MLAAHHNQQAHQLRQQQQALTSIVLDPHSGKVNTVVLTGDKFPSPQDLFKSTVQPPGEPKKPSYLNLACCVNGYSNLTTYDSKFRQKINKSREVSPIRPITTTTTSTSQPFTSTSGHLAVPNHNNYYPTVSQPVGHGMADHYQQQQQRSVMSPEKRLFTAHIMQSATLTSTTTSASKVASKNGGDMTDNVRNGCGDTPLYRTTAFMQQKYTDSPAARNGSVATAAEVTLAATEGSPYKSFIEQRVERLYGPGALAQGFHANRRSMEKSVLSERNIYSNTPLKSNGGSSPLKPGHVTAGLYTPKRTVDQPQQQQTTKNGKNAAELDDTIPVLRHLRPEFRAQLPISSPKRSPPKGMNGGSKSAAGADETELVVGSSPMSLQFQTVSISKLQTETLNKSLTNGSVAKTSGGEDATNDKCVKTTTTTSSVVVAAQNNAEAIDSNNRQISGIDSCRRGGDIGEIKNNNTGRQQQQTNIENGGQCAVEKEVLIENCSRSSAAGAEATEESVKMPTKEEVVENKENAILVCLANGKMAATAEVKKDGNYFLGVLTAERNRILALADIIDQYMEELTVSLFYKLRDEYSNVMLIFRAKKYLMRLLE